MRQGDLFGLFTPELEKYLSALILVPAGRYQRCSSSSTLVLIQVLR